MPEQFDIEPGDICFLAGMSGVQVVRVYKVSIIGNTYGEEVTFWGRAIGGNDPVLKVAKDVVVKFTQARVLDVLKRAPKGVQA